MNGERKHPEPSVRDGPEWGDGGEVRTSELY